MRARPFLIGGEWRASENVKEIRTVWNGEPFASFCVASSDDAHDSIMFAERAAGEMKQLARFEIADALAGIVASLKSRFEDFARTIAREAGKPIALARVETERAIATFTFASEEARRFIGEQLPLDAQRGGKGRTGWTELVPRGIIYGITPFNFPLNLVAHKVAPALASRNAIIIKPSPRTPLSSLMLGEIFLESGLPKSALQIVPVENETIDLYIEDERVKMISFTGSASVGWQLKGRAARKSVTLELGGNAPVIVDETADAETAIEKCAAAAFAYAGQTCISAQRLIVHQDIAREFERKLVLRAKMMQRGDPLDEATTLPAMIDEEAARRVEDWIAEATSNGARLVCGGGREGAFMEATILTDTTSEMRVVAEEVFAPVAVLSTFTNFDDAIAEANNTRYGLQAGVFTRDLQRALQAARELETGGVIINDTPNFRVDNMPYGGVKDSGAGREGVRSAMTEMCEPRVVVINALT